MVPKLIRLSFPYVLVAIAMLVLAQPANAQFNSNLPRPDSDESTSPSTMLKITFSVKVSSTLFADLDTQLRAARFIAPSRFERCMPMTTGSFARYAWLAKFNYAAVVAESVQGGSASPFDPKLDRRIAKATFTNMLGLHMARVDQLRKFWWMPQVASIGFSLGEMREQQAAFDLRMRVPVLTVRSASRR